MVCFNALKTDSASSFGIITLALQMSIALASWSNENDNLNDDLPTCPLQHIETNTVELERKPLNYNCQKL